MITAFCPNGLLECAKWKIITINGVASKKLQKTFTTGDGSGFLKRSIIKPAMGTKMYGRFYRKRRDEWN